MASDAQHDANRRNARKSTGPRTEQGKATSSKNAIRHGLASAQLILFDERPEDFEGFFDDLRTAYAPADAVEDGLVERIAMTQWRLRRVWRAEAAALNEESLRIARYRARAAAKAALAAELKAHPPDGKALTPDEINRFAAIGADALSNDTLEEMMTPGDEVEEREPGCPDTMVWPERMTQLSRYEGALERALSRASRELERRQAERRQMAIAAARAAADQLAAERRLAEVKARPSDPARAETDALTVAALEANIELAKRSQFPPPPRAAACQGGGAD